jgi:hypothetical protein
MLFFVYIVIRNGKARRAKKHIQCIYVQCVQKVCKHPNKIETNDFREKRKNRCYDIIRGFFK